MTFFNVSPEDLLMVQFFLLIFIFLLLAAIYSLLDVIKGQKAWIDKVKKTIAARKAGQNGPMPGMVSGAQAAANQRS